MPMARTLQDWVASDVRDISLHARRWLAEQFFFRDPLRPIFSDSGYFFAPADGLILYQRRLQPDQPLVEIKGRRYTLRDALRDDQFSAACLVIGIFMTVYDVHVNRVPFAGLLHYRPLPAIDTCNRPMLPMESALLRGHVQPLEEAGYLFSNQRVLNRIDASALGLSYYVLQIADYDVSAILPFEPGRVRRFAQNQRFSQVRFGSQVDLIIPLVPRWRFTPLLPDGMHVEAGLDPLVRIERAGPGQ